MLQAAMMATLNTQLLLLLLLLPAQARPATLFDASYNCTVWQPRMCKVIFIAVCTMLYNVQVHFARSLLVSRLYYMYSAEGQTTHSPQSWPLMLQMTRTMGMVATTTMSMGVATTVTALATFTTATPLQLQLPLLQMVTLQLQLQLLLARGTFLAMATLTTATTTTMTPALHQLQPLPVVVMLLLPPQLPPQVTSSHCFTYCICKCRCCLEGSAICSSYSQSWLHSECTSLVVASIIALTVLPLKKHIA